MKSKQYTYTYSQIDYHLCQASLVSTIQTLWVRRKSARRGVTSLDLSAYSEIKTESLVHLYHTHGLHRFCPWGPLCKWFSGGQYPKIKTSIRVMQAVQCNPSLCRLFPDYGNGVHTCAISADVLPHCWILLILMHLRLQFINFQWNYIWEMRAIMPNLQNAKFKDAAMKSIMVLFGVLSVSILILSTFVPFFPNPLLLLALLVAMHIGGSSAIRDSGALSSCPQLVHCCAQLSIEII